MYAKNVNLNSNVYSNGKLLIKIGCILSVMYNTLPVLPYYFRFPLSLIPFGVIFLGILIGNRGRCIIRIYFIFCFLLLFSYIQYRAIWFGRTDMLAKVYGNILVWIPCIITLVMKDLVEPKFLRKLLYVSEGMFAFTAITTMKEFIVNPFAARELATWSSEYDIIGYQIRNVGGFDFIYSLTLSLPIIISLIKNDKKNSLTHSVILILFIMCIYKSQYTMAIIFSVIIILLSLSNFSPKNMFIYITGGIIVFIFSKEILGDFILILSRKTQYDFVAFRLEQLASLLKGTSMSGNHDRLDLYLKSIRAFFKNPIIGVNLIKYEYGRIGGHSFIFDLLGSAGLLGFSYFVTLFLYFFRKIFLIGKNNKNYAYVIIAFFIFILLSCFNPTGFIQIYSVLFINYFCLLSFDKCEKEDGKIINN